MSTSKCIALRRRFPPPATLWNHVLISYHPTVRLTRQLSLILIAKMINQTQTLPSHFFDVKEEYVKMSKMGTGMKTLGVCTSVLNEAKHLAEWIEFQVLIGAELVVIFDDGSTDGTQDIIIAMVSMSVFRNCDGVTFRFLFIPTYIHAIIHKLLSACPFPSLTLIFFIIVGMIPRQRSTRAS
jgi:hypothetical protein